MAYYQKTPPPSRILNFTLNDFSGGLNNRSNQLAGNQASDVLNMQFSDEVLMEKRKGTEYFDAITLTAPITYLDWFRPYTGTNQIVRASDTEVYVDSVKIADTLGKITGANYLGMYYFVDGDKVRVYGTFPQASVGSEIVVTGTPVNSNIVMQLVDPPAGFTPAPAPATRGKWNYNYTTLQTWYEPCNAEVTDTYKGGNVTPLKPKYITVHGDRMFLTGSVNDDDNVYISDIGNAQYFPVFLPIQLPPNSDAVVGIKVFQDSVVIGRSRDMHVIYGNTNRTSISGELFNLKRINTHTGLANSDAMSIVNNYLFFVGSDGNMYAMHTTKTDVELLATQILNTTVDVFKDPIGATLENLHSSHSYFFNDEWHIAINGKVLIYNYRHKAWTMHKMWAIDITYFMESNDRQILFGTTSGRLIKYSDTLYSDLGKSYMGRWASKIFDMGEPSVMKQLREFFIVAQTYTTYNSDITLRLEIDYDDVFSTFGLSNQISIWGKAIWGDRFITRNINASLPITIGRRGRGFRIILENSHEVVDEVATTDELVGYVGAKEGLLVYCVADGKHYLFTNFAWVLQDEIDLFQPMKVYGVNGDYEFRGKRG